MASDFVLTITQGSGKRLIVFYPGDVSTATVKSQIRNSQLSTASLIAEFTFVSAIYNSGTNKTTFTLDLSNTVTAAIPPTNAYQSWYGDFWITKPSRSPSRVFTYDASISERITITSGDGQPVDESYITVSETDEQVTSVTVTDVNTAAASLITTHNTDPTAHANLTPTVTYQSVIDALGYTPASGNQLKSLYLATAISISALRVVTLNDSGLWIYADSSITGHANRAIALATTAVSSGSNLEPVPVGVVSDNSWNWTRGQPIFLGTNGQLTQSVPSSGFLREVAEVLTPTQIFFNPGESILL